MLGIVGRTGAGKSSVLQALFRMTEIESGCIRINGIDTREVGLHNLRRNISIIPQVPFTFAGSVRKNLDPVGSVRDEGRIWEVLRLLQLDQAVDKLAQKLDTDISSISTVFSTGQQQLICLGRVLLHQTEILVLDEATAFVDRKTDDHIQSILKQHFKNTTILTIAHRLNTIADYDRVIVVDDGQVAENDAPLRLLVNDLKDSTITKNGLFAQMVRNTGEENSKLIFEIARNSFEKPDELQLNF